MTFFNRKIYSDVEEGIGLPMWRFTDNMHSFMVVFRALCGEWIETLWLCLLVSSNQTVCFIYYLLLVTVSSFQVRIRIFFFFLQMPLTE